VACAAHEIRVLVTQRSLEARLREIREASAAQHIRSEGLAPADAPMTWDLLGRLEIPRLGLSSVILEGVSGAVLDLAVGHLPDRAPFGRGNMVLAAHRDQQFRDLRNVEVGDRVRVETPRESLEYRVVWTKVTTPSDVSPIAPGGDDVLTLVTCYPFHWVGPAPRRFIVRAVRV
jgi:sortase A